ncbi:MAG TPA: hypothetical protein VLI54_03655 [Bacillota bacterium]|nr:hypothetical protein [Bacillota bacterium]
MRTAAQLWTNPLGQKKAIERYYLHDWLDQVRLRIYKVQGDRKNRDIDIILAEEHATEGREHGQERLEAQTQQLPPIIGRPL